MRVDARVSLAAWCRATCRRTHSRRCCIVAINANVDRNTYLWQVTRNGGEVIPEGT